MAAAIGPFTGACAAIIGGGRRRRGESLRQPVIRDLSTGNNDANEVPSAKMAALCATGGLAVPRRLGSQHQDHSARRQRRGGGEPCGVGGRLGQDRLRWPRREIVRRCAQRRSVGKGGQGRDRNPWRAAGGIEGPCCGAAARRRTAASHRRVVAHQFQYAHDQRQVGRRHRQDACRVARRPDLQARHRRRTHLQRRRLVAETFGALGRWQL